MSSTDENTVEKKETTTQEVTVPEMAPGIPEPETVEAPDPVEEILTERVPEEAELVRRLEGLRKQFPRMDAEAVIRTEAFHQFGEGTGWDEDDFAALAPTFLSDAVELARAQNPPVSRATSSSGGAPKRSLLSPGQQRELAAWNRDYPAYAMTELEYYHSIRNS